MNQIYNDEQVYSIWLSMRENIGKARIKLLIEYFGSAEKIYNAKRDEIFSIRGMSKQIIQDLLNKDLTKAGTIIDACKKAGCKILTISDKNYPERLKNIYDPPTVLYVKGKLPMVDEMPVIGVVGTRECTPYGYKQTEKLCRELSQAGVIISTGMARGIDTAAAVGTLQGDMPVIGVIACGVDNPYPQSNRGLFKKVFENGAVVSEYPPGTPALPAFFPMRNRIISGLSLGVAVIEAPERSGALITTQRALEQCRDVFVLPGNVDSPACIGSNKLLREGAIPFMSSEDILDEYRDLYNGIKKPIDNNESVDYIDNVKIKNDKITGNKLSLEKLTIGLNENERTIIKTIGYGSLFIDEIIANTGIAAHTTLASLTGLEIGGQVTRNNLGKWELKH